MSGDKQDAGWPAGCKIRLAAHDFDHVERLEAESICFKPRAIGLDFDRSVFDKSECDQLEAGE